MITYVLGIGVIWFLGHSFWIVIDGCRQPAEHADVAVVLGNAVNPDGSLSERLRQRLLCGLD